MFFESKPAFEKKDFAGKLMDGRIIKIHFEEKKSAKGNSYWSFKVYCQVREEMLGKYPGELQSPYMFMTNGTLQPAMETHFLLTMGKIKRKQENGKEGFSLEDLKSLEGKECIVLLCDEHYIKKDKESSKVYHNQIPKVYSCFHSKFPIEKQEIFVNDALNYSNETKFNTELKFKELTAVDESVPKMTDETAPSTNAKDDLPW